MRYDKKIIFVKREEGKYNPDLGEYEDDKDVETVKRANVTDLGIDRSVVLFGSVEEGAKVVRMLRHYKDKWDFILIDDKKYEPTKKCDLRLREGFVVQEVVNDG